MTPIVIPTAFKRQMRRKPARDQAAILECIDRLAKDHHHPGLHTHRVRGKEGVFEARVDRGNRVTFQWEGSDIVLLRNCTHAIIGG